MTILWYVAGHPVKRQSEDGNENVEQRQKKINETYSQLLDLAQVSGKLYHVIESFDCTYTVRCSLPVI